MPVNALDPTGPITVVACVKWVDLRPGIDPVHGHLVPSARGRGFSPADEAAVEVALALAECWDARTALLCAGPPEADPGLARLAAAGVDRVVRIDHSNVQDSALTADVLAPVLGPADLDATVVVCGDLSHDRGSGAVPAFLAHHLEAAQALGLIEVEPLRRGRVRAVRRLDGARREVLEVTAPSVLSVEGSTATLRRAPLGSTIGSSANAEVEHRHRRLEGHVEPPRFHPWRPRARVLPPPPGDSAFERIVALTGALVDREPPRTVEATPQEAARLILGQLRDWGYLREDPDPGNGAGGRDGTLESTVAPTDDAAEATP